MEFKEKTITKEKDKEEIDEKVVIANMAIGYEQIKQNYENEINRFNQADNKLNMILVFNAAIITLMFIVFPLNKSHILLSIVFLSIFSICIISTLIFILIGIFPKSMKFMSSKDYINLDIYKCTQKKYYGQFIKMYKKSIDSIGDLIEKKFCMAKHAMIATIVNLLIQFTLLIIKFLG